MVIRYASALLTFAGILALIMGLFFWTGAGLNLLSMHMLLGFLAVGALWVIAVGQLSSTAASWIIAAGALIVGALTVAIGLTQSSLMVGDGHWIVQLGHFVLGVLTIGMGHMGAARFRKGISE